MTDSNKLFEQANYYKKDLEELDRKHEITTIKNDITDIKVLLQTVIENAYQDNQKFSKKIEYLEEELEKIRDQGGHNNGKGSNYRVGF